jgi:hypothetical protein
MSNVYILKSLKSMKYNLNFDILTFDILDYYQKRSMYLVRGETKTMYTTATEVHPAKTVFWPFWVKHGTYEDLSTF